MIKIDTSVEDGLIRIDLEGPPSCCSCFNNSRCLVPFQEKHSRMRAPIGERNPVVDPGGPLLSKQEKSTLLWCSALGYLLPVIGLCIGAAFGEAIDRGLNFENSELFSIICGLSGFAFSFQIIHWITTHYPHRYRVRPASFS